MKKRLLLLIGGLFVIVIVVSLNWRNTDEEYSEIIERLEAYYGYHTGTELEYMSVFYQGYYYDHDLLVIQVDCTKDDEMFEPLVKEMKKVAWTSKFRRMPNVKFVASQLSDSESSEIDTMFFEMNQKITEAKEGDVWYRVEVRRKNGANSLIVEIPDQYSTTGYDTVYPANYGSIYIRERPVEELETIIRSQVSRPEILLFSSRQKDKIDYCSKWKEEGSVNQSIDSLDMVQSNIIDKIKSNHFNKDNVFSYITGWNRTGGLEVRALDDEKMKNLQEELGGLSSLSFCKANTQHPNVYENLVTHGKLLDGDYERILQRLDTYYGHYTEEELAWKSEVIYQGSYYDMDGNLVVLIGMDVDNTNFGPTVDEMKKIAWEEEREMPPVRFAAAYLPEYQDHVRGSLIHELEKKIAVANEGDLWYGVTVGQRIGVNGVIAFLPADSDEQQSEERKKRLREDVILPDFILFYTKE